MGNTKSNLNVEIGRICYLSDNDISIITKSENENNKIITVIILSGPNRGLKKEIKKHNIIKTRPCVLADINGFNMSALNITN